MKLPPGLHTPAIDALRLTLDADAEMLVTLARSRDPRVQAAAIRALGRYETREFTATISQYLATGPIGDVALALAQSLRGEPLALDTSGEQVQRVLEALVKAGEDTLTRVGPQRFTGIDAISRAIGRLPYVRADQVETADAFFLLAMRKAEDDTLVGLAYTPEITRGIETLGRLNARLSPLSAGLLSVLRRVVSYASRYPGPARVNAMAVVMAGGGLDDGTLRDAITSDNEELKRLGVIALAASGSPIDADERTRLLRTLLSDRALIVRIEAVRAWARTEAAANGCGPLLDATRDPDLPVALAAIDALGDACRQDPNVTDWLTPELRTPPQNEWHRSSHALVAMAKRAPDRAAIALTSHVAHPAWQARMYAARAADIISDVATLERLASDPEPNVREATLVPLRKRKGNEAEQYFVASLALGNYQLLHTAAVESKGLPATAAFIGALGDALRRLTLERKETSRDVRLALIQRLAEAGTADQAHVLVPLLQDFDVQVAMAAAATLERWTGKPQEIAPQPLPRPVPPLPAEIDQLAKEQARIELKSGKVLDLVMDPVLAPLTSVRFLRLAKSGYYDRLTFHRIVPNFVVQGGSPGANEYDGDAVYVRDEISRLSNRRGTVGLSTRGRDTGDAQFYFNLVDNPRLDFDYTVFGQVTPVELIDRIVEGDTIASITFRKRPSSIKAPAGGRGPAR